MKRDAMLRKGQSITVISRARFGYKKWLEVKFEHKTHHVSNGRDENDNYTDGKNVQAQIKSIHSHEKDHFEIYTDGLSGIHCHPDAYRCELDLKNNVKHMGRCSIYYHSIDLSKALELEKQDSNWAYGKEPFPYPEKISARELLFGLVEPLSDEWHYLKDATHIKRVWVRSTLYELDAKIIDPQSIPRDFAPGKVNLLFEVYSGEYCNFLQVWLGKYVEVGHRNDFLTYPSYYHGIRHPYYVRPDFNRPPVPEQEEEYWIKKWQKENDELQKKQIAKQV